jgi:lysophospholipase L1-like esterase
MGNTKLVVLSQQVVVLLLLCWLISGCNPTVRGNVLHMGDSLMANSVIHIQKVETWSNQGVLPMFNAIRTTGLKDNDYWVPRIENISDAVHLDIIFCSLGGNDAMAEEFVGAESIANSIDNLMNAIDPETVVYWIPPHNAVGGSRDIVYDEIVYAAARWQNMNVLDFDEWVIDSGLEMPQMLRADGIHLSSSGNKAWANMIQNAITIELPVG